MKRRLSVGETISVGSMLFGLFFGAGNLIFPVSMGQEAGANVWGALLGFLVTGVGIPLLGVAALGMSKSDGLLEMGQIVGRGYSLFFTVALYLTIGPFFAIPRCASTSFSVGLTPLITNDAVEKWVTIIFCACFFGAVLFFSLRPSKILVWVGKVLTPLFLICLAILIVRALISPTVAYTSVTPSAAYEKGAFFKGFLEGYNTMDALAGLAFGIVVVNAIKGLGVKEPTAIAGNTVISGVIGCSIMAVIYAALSIAGAQSGAVSADGGEALGLIARTYFGEVGGWVLAVTVTLACLKTAVGLITSCGEIFRVILPNGPSYTVWTVGFCILSFVISTFGLSTIIAWSLPVLMFLYPLAMTLILLSLASPILGKDKLTCRLVTGFTLAAALFDLVKSLPEFLQSNAVVAAINRVGTYLPMSELGLGWICPAVVGLVIGLVVRKIRN